MTRLKAIEARLAEASPGPWRKVGLSEGTAEAAPGFDIWASDTEIAAIWGFFPHFEANADLITNAPADLRWLLDQRQALLEALQEAERLAVNAMGLLSKLRDHVGYVEYDKAVGEEG